MSDKLTAKQERFAQLYVETGVASQAYREAYDVGQSTKPETIHVRACELLSSGKVAARVEGLKAARYAKAVSSAAVTLDSLTAELDAALRLAMSDPKGGSAAVSAITAKGKLHGYFVERTENANANYNISDEPMTAEEWADEHATEH